MLWFCLTLGPAFHIIYIIFGEKTPSILTSVVTQKFKYLSTIIEQTGDRATKSENQDSAYSLIRLLFYNQFELFSSTVQ